MSDVRYPRPKVLSSLRAGDAPVRLAVIEASAGTGKTFTIEHAVVDLILAGVPLEEVLVVTFTEKATAELRERVRSLLTRVLDCTTTPPGTGAEAWTLDDAARERLRVALFAFDQAPISTIHGFCQRVLTENAFLLGRLLRQELIDPQGAFGAAFKQALREVYACAPLEQELEAWLGSRRSVDDLERLLGDVHRKRAEIRPPLDAVALREAVSSLLEVIQAPGTLTALQASVEASSMHKRTRTAILRRLEMLEGLARNWTPPPSLLQVHVESDLPKILDYLLKSHVEIELKEQGDAGLALVVALRRLSRRLSTYEAAATQLFLPHARERLEQIKAEGGLYDFDDMLVRVRDGLAGDDPSSQRLLRHVRSRFRHALIDEFQDTDEVQWGIFKRVFLESSDEHGLWVVGDPKQAIYGFRGGDVFTYLRARAELEAEGAARVPLQENFRSTPPLLEALHHVYDPTADPAFFRTDEIQYDPGVTPGAPPPALVPEQGPIPAPIKICRLSASPGEVLNAASVRSLHGRWIAREIRRIQDEGLSLERGGERRRIQLGDVFVLTRTTREGVQVAGHLREAGIRHAFYKQGGLLQTREAGDIRRLLAAIEAPWSKARRAEAWTTPFFGLELADLPAAEAAPSDHPLHQRLRSWRELADKRYYEALFAKVLADSGLIRREVFLQESERELTNYLHLFELLLDEVGRTRFDLRELVLLLGSWIDERRSPKGEGGDVQRLESDAEAVQIMSMHKAKGLEAGCVFLFGGITHRKGDSVFLYHEETTGSDGKKLTGEAAQRAWLRGQQRRERDLEEAAGEGIFVYHDVHGRRVVHVGPPADEVLERIRDEREDEERRLIYVATTRAKGRLYLPAFARVEGAWSYPRLGGCMIHVARRLADLADAEDLPAALFEVDEISPDAPPELPPAPDLSGIAAWRPPAELLDPTNPLAEACAALRWDPAHTPRIVTSYSRLKSALAQRPDAGAPEVQASEDPPREDSPEAPALESPPDDGLPGGANMGSFVHEVYEHLDFASLAGDPPQALGEWSARSEIAAIFARAARHYGISPTHIPAAAALVYDSLLVPLELPTGAVPGGLRSVRDPLCEPEFVYPLPDPGAKPLWLPEADERLIVSRGYVRGFIDFLFRHPTCGRAYFLDWKTDRLPGFAPGPTGPLATHVKLHYQIQLQLYSLALARFLRIDSEEAYEERFGGAVYAFVRGMRPGQAPGNGLYAVRPSWDDLKRWEGELAAQEIPS